MPYFDVITLSSDQMYLSLKKDKNHIHCHKHLSTYVKVLEHYYYQRNSHSGHHVDTLDRIQVTHFPLECAEINKITYLAAE